MEVQHHHISLCKQRHSHLGRRQNQSDSSKSTDSKCRHDGQCFSNHKRACNMASWDYVMEGIRGTTRPVSMGTYPVINLYWRYAKGSLLWTTAMECHTWGEDITMSKLTLKPIGLIQSLLVDHVRIRIWSETRLRYTRGVTKNRPRFFLKSIRLDLEILTIDVNQAFFVVPATELNKYCLKYPWSTIIEKKLNSWKCVHVGPNFWRSQRVGQ